MSEHVDLGLELDDSTARWLRQCAQRRRVDVAHVAAEALQAAREAEIRATEEYLDAAEAERHAALYS